MKINSTLKLAICLAGLLALAGSASAQVVNVQMGYTANVDPSMAGTSYSSTAAPLAYAGNVWNVENQQTSGTNLNYSTGSASGINYAFSSGVVSASQYDGTVALPLFRYDAYGTSTGTLTLSGLNNSATYDITLAVFSGGFFDDTVTLGASTQSTTLNSNYSTFVNGVNYVEFDNIAPTSGAITLGIASGPGGQGYDAISGFQIGQVAEVPEPSTMALIGLGGLAFLIIRRRHSLV